MKNITFFLIITSFFTSCKSDAKDAKAANINEVIIDTIKKKDNERAIKTLKEFYLLYYGNNISISNEKVMKKYVSERVLRRIDILTADEENLILDYDPFINGQDFDGDIIKKTLKIEPLKNENEYKVSFLLFGKKDEKRTNIDILLKKNETGNYLIYSILNNEYLNFKNDSKKKQNKFYVLDSISLKVQEKTYKISVLEKTENKSKDNEQHNSNPIILYKGNKKLSENYNLISSYNDNCPADGYIGIDVKNIFFTIKEIFCNNDQFVTAYITFKINENDKIFLYKYGEEYSSRENPDKIIPAKIWTNKDFENISFENTSENFLIHLRQQNPRK